MRTLLLRHQFVQGRMHTGTLGAGALESLLQALFSNGLDQIVDGGCFKRCQGMFIKGSTENNGRRHG